MLTEIDIYRSANVLIHEHGEDADLCGGERGNPPPYRDHAAARNRCLLYPQLRTFSLPSLTSGFDP